MSENLKYFKLGPQAYSFADYLSRLELSKNKPGAIAENRVNARVREANAKGHIVEISKSEYEAMLAQHQENLAKAKDESEQTAKTTLANLVSVYGLDKVNSWLNPTNTETTGDEGDEDDESTEARLARIEDLNKSELIQLAKDLGMEVDKAFEKQTKDEIIDDIEDFVNA